MNSKETLKSEEKLEKATEILWKIIWFCFYLIIFPVACFLVSFYLSDFLVIQVKGTQDFHFTLAFSLLTLIVSLLFFYIGFDRYRNKPFIQNTKNNLAARIHISYLIAIISAILTPILELIASEWQTGKFGIFPLISFAAIYNVTWLYFYFKPIDVFDYSIKEFKHFKEISPIFSSLHNLIIILSYALQIVFLSIAAYTLNSWFYILITNVIFYLIAFFYTRNTRFRISEAIDNNKSIRNELIEFKQRYVSVSVAFLFILLIQLIIIDFVYNPLGRFIGVLEIFNFFISLVIFIFVSLKAQFYVYFHYSSSLIAEEEANSKTPSSQVKKIQKINSLVSLSIILLIFLISILVNLSLVAFFVYIFVFFMLYFEIKMSYCDEKYNNALYLMNSIVILATLTFGILPLVWNFQLLIFCVALYFVLEIFVRTKKFGREDVSIAQNILAIASFYLLAYLFFPFIFELYILFTDDPAIMLFSNIFLNCVIFLIALITSLYRLFFTTFKKKASKFFKLSLIINLFLIEIFLFVLINYRVFFIVETPIFINTLMLSSILFPIIFIFFTFLNYQIGILSKENYMNYSFYASWALLASIFFSIMFIFFNFFGIMIDLIFLSIALHYLVKYGVKLEKISESWLNKYRSFNSYVVAVELFTLLLAIFQLYIFLSDFSYILLSLFFSVAIICALFNILTYQSQLFSQRSTEILTTFTLIFLSFITLWYSSIFWLGSYYLLIVPPILTCIVFYMSIYYMKRKMMVSPQGFNSLLIINSLILSTAIIAIPSVIGAELIYLRLTPEAELFIIIMMLNCTFYLLFGFLMVLQYFSTQYEFKPRFDSFIKKLKLVVWFCITIAIALIYISITVNEILILMSILTFLLLNIYTIYSLQKLEITSSKTIRTCYNLIFFAVTFGFAFLGLYFVYGLIISLLLEINYITITFYLDLFFVILLALYIMSDEVLEYQFSKIKNYFELGSWLCIKITSALLIIYILPFSIFNKITFFIAFFSFFSPITLYFFKKANIRLEKNVKTIENSIVFTFFASIIIFFIEVYLYFFSFYSDNLFVLVFTLAGSLFLIFNYFVLKMQALEKRSAKNRLPTIFFFVLYLFLYFLNIEPISSLLILIFLSYWIYYERNENLILRILCYFFLSYITYFKINLILNFYLSAFFVEWQVILYLLSVILVLFFSISFHDIWKERTKIKRASLPEKFSLYIAISVLSLIYFSTFTNMLLLYNITIAVGVFMFFLAVFLYRNEYNAYQVVKNAFIILLVFDIVSYLSFRFLFILPEFALVNEILIFTLTLTTTGFAFVLLFNDLPEKSRKYSFFTFLTSIVISLPVFFFFLFSSYLPIVPTEPLWEIPLYIGETMQYFQITVPLIIALNLTIFLYFVAVGIYKWEFTWIIWKAGWIAWNFFPIVNFVVIYRFVEGVDVYTNALTLFGGLELGGSLIITIMIASIMYIPVLYTKIREHFYAVLLFFWAESLFLVAWFVYNLFGELIVLSILLFFIIALFLIMPILIKLEYWNITSKLWIAVSVINVVFIYFFLTALLFLLEITISIVLIAVGVFSMIYSIFPNIKRKSTILTTAYGSIIFGIFLLVFSIVFALILNLAISINIAFIIIGFSLFSSKYLKLNKKYTHLLISIILVINFSLLTFFTFILIPGLELFAIFFAVTVFGGSLFVFDHYKMTFEIKREIPWAIMSLGGSLSITSLLTPFFQPNPMFLCFVFTGTIVLLLYPLLNKNRYLLLFLLPLPLTFLLQSILLLIPIIHTVAITTWMIIYLSFLQGVIYIFGYLVKSGNIKVKKPYLEVFQNEFVIEILNSGCFITNSFFISQLISALMPVSWINQIFIFLIIWPILLLCTFKYLELSGLQIKESAFSHYLNGLSLFLYLTIPLAISVNFATYLIGIDADSLFIVLILQIIFSGVLFGEAFAVDKYLLQYLNENLRNWLIFWSWLILSNTTCGFLFSYHYNVFLLALSIAALNIVSAYFLSQISVKYEKMSSFIRLYLINSIFILASLYIAEVISEFVQGFSALLVGTPTILLFLLITISLMFLLNALFNKNIKENLKHQLDLFLYIAFQILLAVYWITISTVFLVLNLFNLSILVILETILAYYIIHALDVLLYQEKNPEFKDKGFSFIIICLYLEVAFLFYSLFESVLISLIVLFTITLIDIYLLEYVRKAYAYLTHALCYFLLSIFLLLYLNEFIILNPEFLWLNLFVFFTMQFYTNYAIFSALKLFSKNAQKIYRYNKVRNLVQHFLGIIFYAFLMVFLQRALVFASIELQLLIIGLSLHILMTFDEKFFKFLPEKWSRTIKIASWMFNIIISIIWMASLIPLLTSLNFLPFIVVSCIPLTIVLCVLEISYLLFMLSFTNYVKFHKEKIQKTIILALYATAISWPLFYGTADLMFVIDLVIASLIIVFLITYIDKELKFFEEKSRILIRRISFLSIGGLLSIVSFIYMETVVQLMIPIFVFTFNLTLSGLIMLLFFAAVIKPFKEHSIKAFVFWISFFSLLSSVLYHISLSYIWSSLFLVITLLLYPFLFLFEEMKEIFGKFVDYILQKWNAFKLAFLNFFRKIKAKLVLFYKNLVEYLKRYWKYMWGGVIIVVFVVVFVLSMIYLNLAWFHALPIGLVVSFVLAFPIFRAQAGEDPEKKFLVQMVYYTAIFGSVVGIILGFIPNIFTILFSIIIFGAILLLFIYREEKRGKLSIKWRFYTTIIFIILIIFLAYLIYLQVSGMVNFL